MTVDVVLSAGNIAHYHHAALALQRRGWLKRYYCTFYGLSGKEPWSGVLPKSWAKRLEGKYVPGLARENVRSFPLPYLATQSLRLVGLFSQDHANLIFSTTFDRLVMQNIPDCRVFHWVHSMGLESARYAKHKGSLGICDVRATHIDFNESISKEEYEKLGLFYHSTRASLRSRLLAETELADYLIVSSNFAAQTYVERGFPRERIIILPYGVAINRFSPSLGEPEYYPKQQKNPFRILFVGNLNPGKGVHYLLQAVSELRISHSELYLIGSAEPDYQRYLESLIPSGLNVRFLGQIPQKDLVRFYTEADVFVYPSLSDAFGLVVYEAMASGLPVIVTENTGAVVQNGVQGFVVPIRSVEALQEKILYFYHHPEECRKMGQAAFELVQDFTWEHYGERLLAVYDQILCHSRAHDGN